MTTIYETKECEEEATILEEEVRKALKALSNGKSAGSDGISIELLKEVDEDAIKVVTNSPRFVVLMGCVWCMCEGRRNTI